MSQELPEQWQQLAERKGIRPTVRGIAEAAGVTASTVSRLVFQSRTSPKTVTAVSDALGITTSDVLRYAGVPAGELGPWDPPREAHLLTGKQRKALDDLIRAFVTEDVRPSRVSPMAAPESTELRHARLDVEEWREGMSDTPGARRHLADLEAVVSDLEQRETAQSAEQHGAQSNQSAS